MKSRLARWGTDEPSVGHPPEPVATSLLLASDGPLGHRSWSRWVENGLAALGVLGDFHHLRPDSVVRHEGEAAEEGAIDADLAPDVGELTFFNG